MKHLTVLRHGKAEDPLRSAQDFARPLTERGEKDSRSAARIVANLQPPVDWCITSPAARASATAATLADTVGPLLHVQAEDGVYMATADALLDILTRVPADKEHVALVGHNPGLEELVSGLCAGNALHMNIHLPTATVAHIELEIFRWDQIRWGSGKLKLLTPPKTCKK